MWKSFLSSMFPDATNFRSKNQIVSNYRNIAPHAVVSKALIHLCSADFQMKQARFANTCSQFLIFTSEIDLSVLLVGTHLAELG